LMGLKPRAPRLRSLRVADVPPGWGMGRTKLLAKPWSGDIVVSTLSLSTFRQRGDLIVSAAGELDAETAWQLSDALRNQEPRLERVILDLRHVIRIDGVGIGAIVTADSQTRDDDQELIVVRPPADVERWLWLTHRDEHAQVVGDLAAVIGPQPKVAG
jgi:anti-anti-sigma factor